MPVLAFILRRIAAWLDPRPVDAIDFTCVETDPQKRSRPIIIEIEHKDDGLYHWRIGRPADYNTVGLARGRASTLEIAEDTSTRVLRQLRPEVS